MTTQSSTYASGSGILPQYGFHSDTKLQSLLTQNPYLFRVYTPKERFPLFDKTDPYFLAHKYNDKYARSPVEIRNHQHFINECNVDYTDVANHMDWTTRVTSPFISTSLSFAWCIWDAVRRFHQGVKKDVEVAIIDGRAIADHAATAVELLELGSPAQRNKDHWKWYRFSDESQSVLVRGSIPGTAVLASIPLLSILRHLPSYFLKPSFNGINAKNPLVGLGWDYTEKKLSYRRFCRDMSNRFHCLSTEAQLADSTAGSLALSLAFLRPWFHQTAEVDADLAVRTLSNLAFLISQWPGHGWTSEHPEIYSLTHAMAVILCQELREEHKHQDQEEVSRLQGIFNELCEVVKKYEVKLNSMDKSSNSNQPGKPKPIIFIDPTAPVFSPSMRGSVSSPARVNSTCARIQTPLTPPDTPKSSSFPSSISGTISQITETQDGIINSSLNLAVYSQETTSREVPDTPLSAVTAFSFNALADQSIQPFQTTLVDLSSSTNLTTPRVGSIVPAAPLAHLQNSLVLPELQPQEIPLPLSPFQDIVIDPGHRSRNLTSSESSITGDHDSWMMVPQVSDLESGSDDHTQVDKDSSCKKELQNSVQNSVLKTEIASSGSSTLIIAPLPTATESWSEEEGPEYLPPHPVSGIFSGPLEHNYTQMSFTRQAIPQSRGMLETAARFAAGFLIGALMTAAVFNSQRRMIVHLT